MFQVYILKCCDGSIYIGQTSDLEHRLAQHNAGLVSWTRPRLPVELLKTFAFRSREQAARFEKKLKSGFGRKWIKKHLL